MKKKILHIAQSFFHTRIWLGVLAGIFLLFLVVPLHGARFSFKPEKIGNGFGAAACFSSAGFYCDSYLGVLTGNNSIFVEWDYSPWGGTDPTCASKGDSQVFVKIVNATSSAVAYTSAAQSCAGSLTYTGSRSNLTWQAGYYVNIVGVTSGYVYSSVPYTTLYCAVYGKVTATGCGIPSGQSSCTTNISWNAFTNGPGTELWVLKPTGSLLTPSAASPAPQPDVKSITYTPAGWSPNTYMGGTYAAGYYKVSLYRYPKSTYPNALSSTTMVVAQQPTFSCSPSTILKGNATSCTWSCYAPDTSSTGSFATGGAMTGTASLSPSATTVYTIQCLYSTGSANATVTVLDPQLIIIASPSVVSTGGVATLSWSATQVTSATLTGPGINQTGTVVGGNVATTTATTPALNGHATYTLTAQTTGGPRSISITVRTKQAAREK